MIPIANGIAPWKEPRTITQAAMRTRIVENEDGTWSFATTGDAVAELVETSAGVYEIVPVGTESAALSRGVGIQLGSTITIL